MATSLRKDLYSYLLASFSADELRLLLEIHTPEVVNHIAWGNAPATVTFEVVSALERRGLITHDFLDAIAAERPGRRSDIDAMRAHLRPRAATGAAAPATAPVRRDTGAAWDIFLAHSSQDKPQVRELYRELKKNGPGYRIFLDEAAIEPGQVWSTAIPEALRSSRVAVVVISRQSSQSWYLEEEVRDMIERMRRGELRIIPVYLDGFGSGEVPYGLKQLHGLDARAEGIPEVARRILEIIR